MAKPKGMRSDNYDPERTHITMMERFYAVCLILVGGIVGLGVADVLNIGFEILLCIAGMIVTGVFLKDYFL